MGWGAKKESKSWHHIHVHKPDSVGPLTVIPGAKRVINKDAKMPDGRMYRNNKKPCAGMRKKTPNAIPSIEGLGVRGSKYPFRHVEVMCG